MAEYSKPLPVPDPDTQPFWDGCRAHELRAQRCSQCGKLRWPPRGLCPHCHSWEFRWEPLSNGGTVYSFVVVHHVTSASFAEDAPYTIANITLDGTEEQVRITSNIVGCPPDLVRVGMPVVVTFEDVTPEISLPKFVPVSSGAAT